MKKIFNTIKIIFLALIVVSAINSVKATDYVSKPSNPPSSNAATPINIGSTSQALNGNLALGTKNNPTTNTTLDVVGSGSINGVASSGNIDIVGNLEAVNIYISGLSGVTTTPQPICIQTISNVQKVIICP